MATWALITFLVGFVSFIFYLYEIFAWFIPFWGIIIMAIAFGMLTRIWHKEKEGEKEKLARRIEQLEDEVAQLKSTGGGQQATPTPEVKPVRLEPEPGETPGT
jgi:membrane protein implicated in regulation of membrane protease activity